MYGAIFTRPDALTRPDGGRELLPLLLLRRLRDLWCDEGKVSADYALGAKWEVFVPPLATAL